MRKLTLPAVVLAAAVVLVFLPPAARANGYYYPNYGPVASYPGLAQGYYGAPVYSHTPGYYVRPAYTYTPGYPYGYGRDAHFHYSPGFQLQWHDHSWNAHLGGWGYGGGFPR